MRSIRSVQTTEAPSAPFPVPGFHSRVKEGGYTLVNSCFQSSMVVERGTRCAYTVSSCQRAIISPCTRPHLQRRAREGTWRTS